MVVEDSLETGYRLQVSGELGVQSVRCNYEQSPACETSQRSTKYLLRQA